MILRKLLRQLQCIKHGLQKLDINPPEVSYTLITTRINCTLMTDLPGHVFCQASNRETVRCTGLLSSDRERVVKTCLLR